MCVSRPSSRSPAVRANPRPQPIATRIGGFGGADGLVRWLQDDAMEAVVDATHPFAVNISANAVAACREAGVCRWGLLVRAPSGRPSDGDAWQVVPSFNAAAAALGEKPRRVLLSLGRLELSAFAAAPAARLHRPHHRSGRPPDFAAAHRLHRRRRADHSTAKQSGALLADERIEVVVSKNSGSPETYAKIEAARALALSRSS